MRFTKRPLESSWTESSPSRLLAALSFLAAGSAAASCSSSDGDRLGAEPEPIDAAAPPVGDAGADAPNVRDAGQLELAPLPVVCTAPPCATALVTTLGATVDDRGEGFCALLQDGTVACWGANGAGQLGRGADAEPIDSPHPQRVVGLSDVAMLDHTCAVDIRSTSPRT